MGQDAPQSAQADHATELAVHVVSVDGSHVGIGQQPYVADARCRVAEAVDPQVVLVAPEGRDDRRCRRRLSLVSRMSPRSSVTRWRRESPATRAMSPTVFQCSTRTARPVDHRCGKRATSPAATTHSAPSTRILASQSTPSDRSRPLPPNHSALGIEPTASTTTAAGTRSPDESSTASTAPSPSNATGTSCIRKVTPASWWRRRTCAPSSVPSTLSMGSRSGATTVTWQPRVTATAATSHPMKLAPTTATDGAFLKASRSACASAIERTTWRPACGPGRSRRRGRSPVAMTIPS